MKGRHKHILVTGSPGSGKTTVIVRLASLLAEVQPAGFYTEEIRENGERQGFRLVSLDGKEGILAHVSYRGQGRVGRYGVDVAGFEKFLSQLQLPSVPSQVVIIDEIGKMESLCPAFNGMMRELLESRKVIVATVALKGEGLIKEVKGRNDCRLVEVTHSN